MYQLGLRRDLIVFKNFKTTIAYVYILCVDFDAKSENRPTNKFAGDWENLLITKHYNIYSVLQTKLFNIFLMKIFRCDEFRRPTINIIGYSRGVYTSSYNDARTSYENLASRKELFIYSNSQSALLISISKICEASSIASSPTIFGIHTKSLWICVDLCIHQCFVQQARHSTTFVAQSNAVFASRRSRFIGYFCKNLQYDLLLFDENVIFSTPIAFCVMRNLPGNLQENRASNNNKCKIMKKGPVRTVLGFRYYICNSGSTQMIIALDLCRTAIDASIIQRSLSIIRGRLRLPTPLNNQRSCFTPQRPEQCSEYLPSLNIFSFHYCKVSFSHLLHVSKKLEGKFAKGFKRGESVVFCAPISQLIQRKYTRPGFRSCGKFITGGSFMLSLKFSCAYNYIFAVILIDGCASHTHNTETVILEMQKFMALSFVYSFRVDAKSMQADLHVKIEGINGLPDMCCRFKTRKSKLLHYSKSNQEYFISRSPKHERQNLLLSTEYQLAFVHLNDTPSTRGGMKDGFRLDRENRSKSNRNWIRYTSTEQLGENQ
ncbi:hypothetical protein Bhyg_13825 [Pseudolycoriella hygida]|uniref:Uncharacterized protein n=1 Tax=Pseudolycoriella hygida TaxID=35572 RepID=A0A9Q0MNK3_9DIPT|nr:hypothetical protein Bhyg_13825 [Pseudolycoriella hygida]